MSRRHYLFTYDISDDRRRTQVFKTLCDNGDHAQYSVFFCELNPKELVLLRARIARTINEREDQVIILDLGVADHELDLSCIGLPYCPQVRARIV